MCLEPGNPVTQEEESIFEAYWTVLQYNDTLCSPMIHFLQEMFELELFSMIRLQLTVTTIIY